MTDSMIINAAHRFSRMPEEDRAAAARARKKNIAELTRQAGLAAAAMPAPTGPDAELIDLGSRVDYLIAQSSCDDVDDCDVNDAMDPISRKIMDFAASTFAGLAIKARVAQHCCSHYWDESYGECDFDKLMARQLIESVLNAAGAVS